MFVPPDSQRAAPRCCIVADDLTGSCDAGVHFARRGMTVAVAIAGEVSGLPPAQVVAINTGSRCVGEQMAAGRVRAVFERLAGTGAELFKKIDSSLRGHVAAEIGAAMGASGCGLAFVAPSLPALGRTVERSRVVLPSGEGIGVAEALSPLSCRVIPVGDLAHFDAAVAGICDARECGTKIFCFDADSDAHLDQIVALGRATRRATGQRILWVGSAGLAAALARAMASVPEERAEELFEAEGAVLFGVGSDHGATLAQVARLRERGDVAECSLDACGAVDAGRDVLLQLPPCGIDAAKIVAFAEAAPLGGFGGIVLTGGDTAAAFLLAIGAHTLEVRAEVMPGIPVSVIRGGVADGMSVITKSGAFGPADAFLRCADFFRGAGRVVEEGAGR